MQVTAGTRALITGASRGIGRALAIALATRGATLGLAARGTDELDQLAAQLPGEHHPLQCDVADPTSVHAAIDTFVTATGGLDLLIANAGIAHYGNFTDQPLETQLRMSQTNWHGTLHTIHFGLPHMRQGHIVIVSSGAGLRSFPQAAVYGATKAAQRAFGEALRHELAGTGIGLTVVHPGEIATTLHDHEKHTLPPWYGKAASPDPLVAEIIQAIERDERAVYYPREVRALRIAHGISPKLTDALLRRIRHQTAAPRRD